MRNQIVQWIFLPGGLTEDGQLAASVFVAPLLRSDEGSTLADFPDWTDWPSLLNTGSFRMILQREDMATESPMQVTGGGSSALWQALFPAETPLRPFEFDDYADRPLITYPFMQVYNHLMERWATLALMTIDDLPFSSSNVSPIGSPITQRDLEGRTLSSHFERLRAANQQGILANASSAQEISDRMAQTLANAAAQAAFLRAQHNTQPQPLIEPFALQGPDNDPFYQLLTFHRRPQRDPAEFPHEREAARAELADKMEFHHLLSTIGDHPELLRMLGLAFDLVIRPDFLPTLTEQDVPSKVRVLIERPSNFPKRSNPEQSPWNLDVSPWTSCRLTMGPDGASFSAAENGGSQTLVHGFVHMDPNRYSLVGVDVDGLALKALNMAATLDTQEKQPQRPVEEEAKAGVPAPRTGGVALTLTGRAQEIHNDFYSARQADDALKNDPENPPTLTASQLVRGYRVDIRDGNTGEWRSLHARHVDYTPLRNPNEAFSVGDEGFIQLALTSDVDRPNAPANPDSPLYVHETLVTWDGWSLAAPRPGRPIAQEPPPPEASADLGALQLDLKVKALPASLPRLRFGANYQLRLRTVDLTGKSHSLDRANSLTNLLDSSGLPEFRVTLPENDFVYPRFEPVPPPSLVARNIFAPGEGLERLVVRSNVGVTAEDFAAASQAAEEEMLRYHPYCDRHIAPPKTSLQLAEAHRMFDEAIEAARGLSIDEAAAAINRFYQIAVRENGSFRDDPGARFVPTGLQDGVEQGYVTIDADTVSLPYLPDPWSNGVVIWIQFSPIEPEQRFDIPFRQSGDWYEFLPLRLRLEEGAPAAEFNEIQQLFTVRLPKGHTARMRINSLFMNDPDLFGTMDWCRKTISPAEADLVYHAIRESRHWMTTPWSRLQLVHAVQQPLVRPELELDAIDDSSFKRRIGTTAAELAGIIRIDGASTASLDLRADWDDVVDDPEIIPLDENNMKRHMRANAFQIVLPEVWGTPWGEEIKYLLEALDTDGGQEWRVVKFSTVDQEGPERMGPQRLRADLLQRSANPALSAQEKTYLAAAAAQLEGLRSHEFGDTRYRRVAYQVVAATRFREYFDPQMSTEAGITEGNIVTVEMLSSAPPPPPSVLDVVPIVRWENENSPDEGQHTSTRRNMGLRVWLARPWFTSGEGEMLGLVCTGGAPLTPANPLFHQESVISQDPTHASVLPLPLRPTTFFNADAVATNIYLGIGNEHRDLVLFQPHYDQDHNAWYCDIAFETSQSYFPFVRLGLVRYQAKSIPNCQVSSIVTTAFLQPLPDRSLTVVHLAENQISVKLRGPGPRARRTSDGNVMAETNIVTAVVEVQDLITSDPALGWGKAGEEVLLTPVLDGESQVEWSGDVFVPAELPRPLRLTVREFEVHDMDDRSGVTPIIMTGRRLVHVVTLSLD